MEGATRVAVVCPTPADRLGDGGLSQSPLAHFTDPLPASAEFGLGEVLQPLLPDVVPCPDSKITLAKAISHGDTVTWTSGGRQSPFLMGRGLATRR
jgi:hypothetical protein